jgi:hypothetical protein
LLQYLKHTLNPLHIYCRLRNLGVDKDKAIYLCRLYERYVFRFFTHPVRLPD